ncbi:MULTISPECIES: PEGA domain-containing protein [unclassified Methanoregula]|uniref:PEGA domain-containing protein n=1 Tax=unclassified Methanoregula TaxID=2649730 RepID=UPI0009C52EA1|nr:MULTISPECIES: PEGA domain-containing protein [unclassified Methanoregula]OPX62840.1 MAG: PEGA domain protein [Methanoregula sp. PtaB.Bin085]OPY35277.1 MAG: PEGA domain protein [Methanoregula sp. PtaU1.Bin006]
MPLLKTVIIIAMLAAVLLVPSCCANIGAGIRTTMGDEVVLSGTCTSSPFVYIFLTGPNLPENGVTLQDVSKRADRGYFTKVSVDGDDRWNYRWHTGSINGRLDEGTYTIWVVDAPNDRSRLASADYKTISVTLGKPSITVDTPGGTGSMDLKSDPDGASVTVNGESRGKTPLRLGSLRPGTYMVAFSLPGYRTSSAQVTVQGGAVSEVTAKLGPETGSFFVNSTPAGARVLVDGAAAGFTPLILENITAGSHTITLEKDGYAAATRQVTPASGLRVPVDVALEPLPATTAPATTAPAPTRASGLLPALAGALLTVFIALACRNSRYR